MIMIRSKLSNNFIDFTHTTPQLGIEPILYEVISPAWTQEYRASLLAMIAHRLPISSCMSNSDFSSSGVRGEELTVLASLCRYLDKRGYTFHGTVFHCRGSQIDQSWCAQSLPIWSTAPPLSDAAVPRLLFLSNSSAYSFLQALPLQIRVINFIKIKQEVNKRRV